MIDQNGDWPLILGPLVSNVRKGKEKTLEVSYLFMMSPNPCKLFQSPYLLAYLMHLFPLELLFQSWDACLKWGI